MCGAGGARDEIRCRWLRVLRRVWCGYHAIGLSESAKVPARPAGTARHFTQPHPTDPAWAATLQPGWQEERKRLEREGFLMLSVGVPHAVAVASLPDHHQDPFDRLLIAQARLEGLTIVTADAAFDDYQVQVLDARA